MSQKFLITNQSSFENRNCEKFFYKKTSTEKNQGKTVNIESLGVQEKKIFSSVNSINFRGVRLRSRKLEEEKKHGG